MELGALYLQVILIIKETASGDMAGTLHGLWVRFIPMEHLRCSWMLEPESYAKANLN